MDRTIDASIHGDPEQVASELGELFERTGAEELIASSSTHDRQALRRSDSALAALFPR